MIESLDKGEPILKTALRSSFQQEKQIKSESEVKSKGFLPSFHTNFQNSPGIYRALLSIPTASLMSLPPGMRKHRIFPPCRTQDTVLFFPFLGR